MIEWNEENFDIDMNGYTRMCYAEKICIFKRLCQTLGGGKVWRDLFGYRRGSDSATGKAIAGRCIFRI